MRGLDWIELSRVSAIPPACGVSKQPTVTTILCWYSMYGKTVNPLTRVSVAAEDASNIQ